MKDACTLVRMYEEGKGAPQNYAEATKWYRKAAELGIAEAQSSLGRMYESGLGVPQNYVWAHMWFNLAIYRNQASLDELGPDGAAAVLGALQFDPAAKMIAARDRVASKMTAAQIAQAQARAEQCLRSNYKDCGWPQAARQEDEVTAGETQTMQGFGPADIPPPPPGFTLDQPPQVAGSPPTGQNKVMPPNTLPQNPFADLIPQPGGASPAGGASPFDDLIPPPIAGHSTGTGFFVSQNGHIVTNAHVVHGCQAVRSSRGGSLRQVSTDEASDLAVFIASEKPTSFARLRGGYGARTGEPVVAVGFPLSGVLSSDPIVTTGTISALSGLGDDRRQIQISAPVQPGNSGGPLLGEDGSVVGVVVGKLNALKLAEVIGDIPQNVNFAVSLGTLQSFLNANGVDYVLDDGKGTKSPADIAAEATRYTVLLECLR